MKNAYSFWGLKNCTYPRFHHPVPPNLPPESWKTVDTRADDTEQFVETRGGEIWLIFPNSPSRQGGRFSSSRGLPALARGSGSMAGSVRFPRGTMPSPTAFLGTSNKSDEVRRSGLNLRGFDWTLRRLACFFDQTRS